jgi:hypothetical protein
MHPTVKAIRAEIKSIDGAWVRRWKDGTTRVGCRFAIDAQDLSAAVNRAGFAIGEFHPVLRSADLTLNPNQ